MLPISHNEIKSAWRQDGNDYRVDLGTQKNAVVIRFYAPNLLNGGGYVGGYYSISPCSYLPFTDEQHSVRFCTASAAIAFAEKIVLAWLNSLLMPKQANLTQK